MAIVRICQLGELDDLAKLIAELRGASYGVTSPAAVSKSQPPAKKNAASAAPTLLSMPGLADSYQGRQADVRTSTIEPPAPEPGFERRNDSAHSVQTSREIPSGVELSASSDDDSVVARYRRRMAEGAIERTSVTHVTQPRLSRREQTTRAAEHPLVRRAIELFDAPLEKLRYTPPEERSSGVEQ